MSKRRDSFQDLDGLGETLSALMGDHQAATTEAEEEGPQGVRGPRQRPRFPSEAGRIKLTVDIDLEPSVAPVLRVMAANEQELYGPGKIRTGDLATTALILGLLEIASGQADIEAEWTARSRGSRNIGLGTDLQEKWWTLVQGLEIDR